VPTNPIGTTQHFVRAGSPDGAPVTPALPHAADDVPPVVPFGTSPALPRVAPGASSALPHAAPSASSTSFTTPLRAPVVPPGFLPLPVHARDFHRVFERRRPIPAASAPSSPLVPHAPSSGARPASSPAASPGVAMASFHGRGDCCPLPEQDLGSRSMPVQN
jgi:hypothetical protein